MSVHGTAAGGISVSYQQFYYNGTNSFYDGLNELGIPTAGDPNAGATSGASFLPMSINADTKQRSDARRVHYDPNAARDNLYISSGQFVTRLIWDGDEDAGNSTDDTADESGTATSGNGQSGSSTNPSGAVTSSVDGVSAGSGKSSSKPPTAPNASYPSGSAWSNMTVPTWSNGSTSASVDGSSSNGQGKHWGLKISDIEGGLSSGLGIFNLFDTGNLFDLLKSSAPADWDSSSGVEVHEVTTTKFECNCKEESCSAKSDDKKQKKTKRQALPNLRVAGVEYAAAAGAERRIITAKREVILAAGAVHTPLILQHSGVGASEFLSTFDIETRIDLPGVGENYQDHYQLASSGFIPFIVKNKNSVLIC